jgi:Uma2 family endonuclease
MATVADHSGTAFQKAAFPPEPVCQLGVDMYEEMIQAGIITKDARIELLDGWMVPKMTKNPPHILAAELVRDILYESMPAGWCVFSEQPIRVGTSMPEPDAAVVRGQRRQYGDRRIRAENVGLIVEVADASLARDKSLKKSIYAQAGIPVYWLVNLVEHRVEVYTDPTGSDENADYRQRHDYLPNDEIPLTLDGQTITAIPAQNILP